MAKRPGGVTKEEWAIYLKVAAIMGSISKPTRKDPDYYAKIAKKRWEKVRQAREAE